MVGSLFVLLGCGGGEKTVNLSDAVGSIMVEVRDADGEVVEDALITTNPETEDMLTDRTGTALLEEVPPGRYRVTAEKASLGTVTKTANVQADKTVEVYLEFDESQSAGSGGSGGDSGSSGSGGTSGAAGTAGDSGSGGTAGSIAVRVYIPLDTQVESILADSKRPYLYALDKLNNELLFVNLDDKMVEKSLAVGTAPTDMDMDEAGDFIYVANSGSTELAVVNLQTQDIERTLVVNPSPPGSFDDGNPTRVAVGAGNTLVFTSEDYSGSVKLVDATTGVHIAVSGTVSKPDVAASVDGANLFVADQDANTLLHYSISQTDILNVDSTTAAGTYRRQIALSGDGLSVFFAARKYAASNLQAELGMFGEAIYTVNFDGSIAIGQTNIFSGTTFEILRPLRVHTTVMALSADAGTIYLFDDVTNRVYVEDISDL